MRCWGLVLGTVLEVFLCAGLAAAQDTVSAEACFCSDTAQTNCASSWHCSGGTGDIPQCHPDPTFCFDKQSQGSPITCHPDPGSFCVIPPPGFTTPILAIKDKARFEATAKELQRQCARILRTMTMLTAAHPLGRRLVVVFKQCQALFELVSAWAADPPDLAFRTDPVCLLVPERVQAEAGVLSVREANAINAFLATRDVLGCLLDEGLQGLEKAGGAWLSCEPEWVDERSSEADESLSAAVVLGKRDNKARARLPKLPQLGAAAQAEWLEFLKTDLSWRTLPRNPVQRVFDRAPLPDTCP